MLVPSMDSGPDGSAWLASPVAPEPGGQFRLNVVGATEDRDLFCEGSPPGVYQPSDRAVLSFIGATLSMTRP